MLDILYWVWIAGLKGLGNNLAFRLLLERVQLPLCLPFSLLLSPLRCLRRHSDDSTFLHEYSETDFLLDSLSSSHFSQHTSPTQVSLFQHAANRPPSLPHREPLYRIIIPSGSFFTLGSEFSDTWSYSLATCDSVSKCIDIFGEKSRALHLFPRKRPGWDDHLRFHLSSDKCPSSDFLYFFPLTALTCHISL